MENLEYNTDRDALLLKEYGRNVQKLIHFISKEEDIEKRTEQANTLVRLMTHLNPSIKANSDNLQRVWDHLYIMSDFSLEINGPFSTPKRDIIIQTPDKLAYKNASDVTLRHYGRNLELTVRKVLTIENEDEKKESFIQLARTMKSFYFAWYKEVLDDNQLLSDLKRISKGQIDLAKEVEENPKLFDIHLSSSGHSLRNENPTREHDNKRGRGRRKRRK